MLEKTLIKQWVKEIMDNSDSDEVVKIEKAIKGSNTSISVHLSEYYGELRILEYLWLTELYSEAKKAIEDEHWFIQAAYKISEDIALVVKHKTKENLFYQGVFFDEREETGNFHFTVKPIRYERRVPYLLSPLEVPELESKAFMDKEKQIEAFFYNWCLKNNKDRLLILTGKVPVIREK